MRSKAVDHFVDEVSLVINRFRKEYEMSYAELVGTLELIKADLVWEMFTNIEEDDGEEESGY